MKRSLLAISALLLTAPLAFAGSLPFASAKTAKGEVLTDAQGMTLYIYDKDSKGMSTCYGDCADDWPPLIAKTDATASGPYSLVTRRNGQKQWAFKGMPLYFYSDDTAKGQASGDGENGVWHVIPAAPTTASAGGSW
jgi:predicted lipoprotein with Yx(FWY)xxD motif